MNRKRILLAALLAALIVSIVAMTSRQSATASSALCTAANYNAVNDFSTTSNPNSPWSYGWEASLGGPFTLNAAERTVYEGLDTWEGPQGCGGEFNLPIVSLNHTGTTLNYASGVSQPANMLNLHPSCSGKLRRSLTPIVRSRTLMPCWRRRSNSALSSYPKARASSKLHCGGLNKPIRSCSKAGRIWRRPSKWQHLGASLRVSHMK